MTHAENDDVKQLSVKLIKCFEYCAFAVFYI